MVSPDYINYLGSFPSSILPQWYRFDHLFSVLFVEVYENVVRNAVNLRSELEAVVKDSLMSKADYEYLYSNNLCIPAIEAIGNLLIFDLDGQVTLDAVKSLRPGSEIWNILSREPQYKDLLIRFVNEIVAQSHSDGTQLCSRSYTTLTSVHELALHTEPMTAARRRELLLSNDRVLDFLIECEALERGISDDTIRYWVMYGDGLDYLLGFPYIVDDLLKTDAYLHPNDIYVKPMSDYYSRSSVEAYRDIWCRFHFGFNYELPTGFDFDCFANLSGSLNYNDLIIEQVGKGAGCIKFDPIAVYNDLNLLPESVRYDWIRYLLRCNLDFIDNTERFGFMIKTANSLIFNGYPIAEYLNCTDPYFRYTYLNRAINNYETALAFIDWNADASMYYINSDCSLFESFAASTPENFLTWLFKIYCYDNWQWFKALMATEVDSRWFIVF